MPEYRADREWSDLMVPQIKQIVGPFLLENAPFEFDAKQATDLMVFKARDMRIAARVRRPGYSDRYPFEFTIRCKRDSGAETELSKIINGWGDWLFYGHADASNWIEQWWLIDLHSFRAALIRTAMNGATITVTQKDNGDGTYFKAFDLRSFPRTPAILVSGSQELMAVA